MEGLIFGVLPYMKKSLLGYEADFTIQNGCLTQGSSFKSVF